jgi:hypothetical protein
MMRSARRIGIGRLALAATIGLAVTIGSGAVSARAADDNGDGEPELLDQQIVRGILNGLGLRRDEAALDYRERSPLVLPANKELPVPERNSTAKAANWPDDPDVKEAKRRKKAERERKPYTEGVDDRPLLPSEYGIAAPPRTSHEGSGPSIEQASKPSTRTELGAKDLLSDFSTLWAPKEEYGTFTAEPPRASLIDPPPGYRTPSPNQPYGVGKDRWNPTVVDRQEYPK